MTASNIAAARPAEDATPASRSGHKSTYCVINFNPNVELVSVVRRFVSDFYEQLLIDPDATSRVALATHELLENAVGYSTDGETKLRIEIDERGDDALLTIRIRNRTTPEHIAAMRSAFAELSAAADPIALYHEIMVRNAKREDGSGLGLARIRAEAEMALEHEVDGDEVSIIARTRVQTTKKAYRL